MPTYFRSDDIYPNMLTLTRRAAQGGQAIGEVCAGHALVVQVVRSTRCAQRDRIGGLRGATTTAVP